MKATLRIPAPETECGYKEIEVDIIEEELARLAEPQKTSKLTGYERAKKDDVYYYVNARGETHRVREICDEFDNNCYDAASYYSFEVVAENNARADKLMRQLRRFAVEHRESDIDWNNFNQEKWFFDYDYKNVELTIESCCWLRDLGSICFDSYKTAQDALNAFHDELIWYFTKYKDSL